MAETHPEAVLPALDAIAGAGSEALTSMRRLVGVLRADDHATRHVGVTLDDLRKMVDQFSPAATFDLGPGVSSLTLAPEVLTTLHRVLTESLTNVRRHAPHAPWVEVRLTTFDDAVRLRVANPLSAADPRLSRLGGGFGLVGMAERVETMGGRLLAGPVAGHRWRGGRRGAATGPLGSASRSCRVTQAGGLAVVEDHRRVGLLQRLDRAGHRLAGADHRQRRGHVVAQRVFGVDLAPVERRRAGRARRSSRPPRPP